MSSHATELVDEDGEPFDVQIVIRREIRGRYVVEALEEDQVRSSVENFQPVDCDYCRVEASMC